jgi:hypothetical protein
MQDFMPHHSHTSIFTTVSGVVGGVGKAVTAKPLLMAITLPGLTTVVLYAAASAAAVRKVCKSLIYTLFFVLYFPKMFGFVLRLGFLLVTPF